MENIEHDENLMNEYDIRVFFKYLLSQPKISKNIRTKYEKCRKYLRKININEHSTVKIQCLDIL